MIFSKSWIKTYLVKFKINYKFFLNTKALYNFSIKNILSIVKTPEESSNVEAVEQNTWNSPELKLEIN